MYHLDDHQAVIQVRILTKKKVHKRLVPRSPARRRAERPGGRPRLAGPREGSRPLPRVDAYPGWHLLVCAGMSRGTAACVHNKFLCSPSISTSLTLGVNSNVVCECVLMRKRGAWLEEAGISFSSLIWFA